MFRYFLIAVTVVTTACGGLPTRRHVTALAGGPTAREAVQVFLIAAQSKNPDVLVSVWGSERGPARMTMGPGEIDRLGKSMACLFSHDSASIVDETDAPNGGRAVKVNLVRGTETLSTTLIAVRATDGRWYVRSVDNPPETGTCS